jgi:hypothetical protein
MASWNNEITTTARDASIMRTHVIPQWGDCQLAKIDHLSVQTWITELTSRRSRSTAAECKRLISGVLRSAVRNRLIGHNPAEDVKVPVRRVRDTDERIITRRQVRDCCYPPFQSATGRWSPQRLSQGCDGARSSVFARTLWTWTLGWFR